MLIQNELTMCVIYRQQTAAWRRRQNGGGHYGESGRGAAGSTHHGAH